MTTFTQLTARLKNFLMDWLLVLGLEEGLVECATLCVKSWVILTFIYRLIRYKSDYTYQVLRPFLAIFCEICMVIFHKTEIQTVILRCLTGQNLGFWKYDSWFPSEDSKLTSVGNKLKLLLKYWFFEAKVGIWICYGPKKWSKYLVDTIQTTFCK